MYKQRNDKWRPLRRFWRFVVKRKWVFNAALLIWKIVDWLSR